MIRPIAAGLLAMALFAGPAQAQNAPPPAAAPAPNPLARDAMIGAALHVADLPRALKFYRDTLGMKVLMQFTPPGAKDRSRPDAVLNFGGGPADTLLMLLADRDPAGPRPITHSFGFSRIVMRLANLDGVAEKLRANGFTPGPINQAHGAIRVMMITDPDGYTVELIER